MKKRVALVTGGESKEREISLKSAETIFKHLDKELYDITLFDLPKDYTIFIDQLASFSLVIPVIHGIGGENGEITVLCEKNNIPVFFTSSESHQLCIDKYLCTLFLEKKGITVPKTTIIDEKSNSFVLEGGDRVFIKPVHGGSSVDSGICATPSEVKQLVEKIVEYDQALIQQYIAGQEFTVSIVGDWDSDITVYAISEIVTGQGFFDYEAKYELKNTQEITPANISLELQKYIEETSTAIYKYCKLTCLARIDFIYQKENNMLYFLEVNTIPGFTESSFFPQAIQHRGLSISAFIHNTISKISG